MGGEHCMKAGILMIEQFEKKEENIEQKVRIEQKSTPISSKPNQKSLKNNSSFYFDLIFGE